jgi:hypothetical protein
MFAIYTIQRRQTRINLFLRNVFRFCCVFFVMFYRYSLKKLSVLIDWTNSLTKLLIFINYVNSVFVHMDYYLFFYITIFENGRHTYYLVSILIKCTYYCVNLLQQHTHVTEQMQTWGQFYMADANPI